jgi:hypothetical protein
MSEQYRGGGDFFRNQKTTEDGRDFSDPHRDIFAMLAQETTPANVDKKQDPKFFPVAPDHQEYIDSVTVESRNRLRQKREEKIRRLEQEIAEAEKELEQLSQKPSIWKRIFTFNKQQASVYRRDALKIKISGLKHNLDWEKEQLASEINVNSVTNMNSRVARKNEQEDIARAA